MLSNDQSSSELAWLKQAKGSTVREILVLDFVERETGSRKPVLVWITLSNKPGAGIKCAGDGESLEIDHEYPSANDLGEYGRTELRQYEFASGGMTEKRIDDIMALCDGTNYVGLRLILSGGEIVSLANIGDELTFVQDDHPIFGEIRSGWQSI